MEFNEAFKLLIDHEGEFSNDPEDRGNWTGGKLGRGELKGTKYGISAMSYPDLDIKNLTLEQAKAIYLGDFWSPLVEVGVPPACRFSMFDAAVNSGHKFAIEVMQEALGVKADGVVGPNTRNALQHVASKAAQLNNRIFAIRLDRMTSMPGWKGNSRGWARRVVKNILLANPL